MLVAEAGPRTQERAANRVARQVVFLQEGSNTAHWIGVEVVGRFK
jgi:hypothetical protein